MNNAIKLQHVLFANEPSLRKMLVSFFSSKIPWKNYVRFWKWNLKRTPESAQNCFLRKSNLNFCQGRSEGTSSVEFEVLTINRKIEFVNLFILKCLTSNINFFIFYCLTSNFCFPKQISFANRS